MNYLKSITTHWFVMLFLLHIFALMLQIYVFLPIEINLFGPLTAYASFLFLPHAVRVLAAWLLGPKALFALIPAEVIVTLLFFNPLAKHISAVIIVAPIVAASTAVVAFEFMKFMKIDVYPNVNSSPNWRGVVFAGILASLFNSISGTLIKTATVPTNGSMSIIIRYLVGDISGLLLGMLLLMLTFKLLECSRLK